MKKTIRQAASAHEMLMMNLAIFHLLLPVAALSSGYIPKHLQNAGLNC
ncbi:MAG: hypothetical protein RQ783_02345 [Gammaproteobacteria bacterium]|nr:hypothetical protein [Gammaproteobacteria bacterium]